MEHADPELLALLALGETTDPSLARHAAECPQCRADLERLRRVVVVGREVGPEDSPVEPHPDLWRRIAADVAIQTPPVTALQTREPVPILLPTPVTAARRPGRLLAVAAGIVGLLAGVAIAGLPALLDDDAPSAQPEPSVVARATLAPLPDRSLTGSALVVQAAAGRVLQLRLGGTLPPDGYREVWLLTPDAKGLVSLGALPGPEADIPLPAGLDLTAFPVVDVSQEQFDGNPAHSADSLSRGTLG